MCNRGTLGTLVLLRRSRSTSTIPLKGDLLKFTMVWCCRLDLVLSYSTLGFSLYTWVSYISQVLYFFCWTIQWSFVCGLHSSCSLSTSCLPGIPTHSLPSNQLHCCPLPSCSSQQSVCPSSRHRASYQPPNWAKSACFSLGQAQNQVSFAASYALILDGNLPKQFWKGNQRWKRWRSQSRLPITQTREDLEARLPKGTW